MNSSDRNRDGLRGPVKSYTEETVSTLEIPGSGDTSATLRTTKVFTSATYALDGRILQRRQVLPDNPESVTEYHYDSENRLIEEQYSSRGKTLSTQPYSYDEQGRRTKTSKFPDMTSGIPPNTAVAATPWEDSTLFYQALSGGTLTTIYNKNGKAIEGEFRNLQDQVVTRFGRKFDAHGNVVEEMQESATVAAESSIATNRNLDAVGLGELNEATEESTCRIHSPRILGRRREIQIRRC